MCFFLLYKKELRISVHDCDFVFSRLAVKVAGNLSCTVVGI